MFRFTIICFVLLSNSVLSQIGVKSFYFTDAETKLTEYSEQKFQELIEKQTTHNLQLIELNAFDNSSQNYRVNKETCKQRIAEFTQRLGLDSTEFNIGNYGSRRIPLNFKPTSWNRIDIYYSFSPRPDSVIETIPENEIVEVLPIIDTIPIEFERETPEVDEIIRGVVIATPIQFIGGKTKISESSRKYIYYLIETFQAHPELNAHIRGHVCCGPDKRASKKRAKSVYKELIKGGVNRKRLTFAGYSNSLPIVYPEKNERDRKKNRRVEIIFIDE